MLAGDGIDVAVGIVAGAVDAVGAAVFVVAAGVVVWFLFLLPLRGFNRIILFDMYVYV